MSTAAHRRPAPSPGCARSSGALPPLTAAAYETVVDPATAPLLIATMERNPPCGL